MKLEAFNEQLKRNLDPRCFCSLDTDPAQVRHVRYAGRRREPERRYVVWLKLGDGTTKMLLVIRDEKGGFRDPCEKDIADLHEVLRLFQKLWSKITPEGQLEQIRAIENAIDRRWLETQELKWKRFREFVRRESAPRMMHLFQKFSRAHFSGKRQFTVN